MKEEKRKGYVKKMAGWHWVEQRGDKMKVSSE